ADAEQLAVTDRELENWLQILAMVGGQRRRLRDLSAGQRAALAGRLRRDKAASRLVEIATQEQAGQSVAAPDEETRAAVSASEVNAKAAAQSTSTHQAMVDATSTGDSAPEAPAAEQPAPRPGRSGRSSRADKSGDADPAAAKETAEAAGEP